MPAPANLVHQISTSTGTGNLTLTNVSGKQAFVTAFPAGTTNEFDYFISNRSAAEYERGTGHVSAGALVRDTVIESTNANAAVNFSAGTKDITNDIPAAKQVTTDTTQTLTNKTLTDPIVGTQTARDNSTKAASTAYVDAAVRDKLTAARTYYVRTDGSDTNDGLANTSGGAFLTIQKAIDVAAALDLSIYDLTIKLGNTGTFTSGADVSGPWVGKGEVILEGDTTTPSNTLISTSSLPCIYVHGGGRLKIKHFKMTSSASSCIYVTDGSIVNGGGLDFGSANNFHWLVSNGSVFAPYGTGGYTISGGAQVHFYGELGSKFYIRAVTITLTGTPAFSAWFCNLILGTTAYLDSLTFSGSATGPRYSITSNAAVNTGGSTTYFPGNSAGSTATGGVYS